MKANAPEKIYIHPDIGGREFLRPWLRRAASNESIEYTRTDAFVKKACEWLEAHSPFVNDDIVNVWLDNFKKAMKL